MMAAHSGAAATQAPGTKPYHNSFEAVSSTSLALNLRIKYSPTELMVIMDSSVITISPKLKSALGRQRLLRTTEWCSRVWGAAGKRKRCARRQKRGKRAGGLAQLKARRPPIPTLFLANVCSLDNKVDLLRLRLSVSMEMRNCAVLCLTETICILQYYLTLPQYPRCIQGSSSPPSWPLRPYLHPVSTSLPPFAGTDQANKKDYHCVA